MTEHEQVAAAGKRRRTLEQRLYDALGGQWCGNTTPPMDNRKYTWAHEGDDYRVFAQGDDGGTMWIGYGSGWNDHLSLARFRRIAIWTIWTWAWADWFGLRTWAWYKLLHRRCNRIRGNAGQTVAEYIVSIAMVIGGTILLTATLTGDLDRWLLAFAEWITQ